MFGTHGDSCIYTNLKYVYIYHKKIRGILECVDVEGGAL
jgi:hypothetical protein